VELQMIGLVCVVITERCEFGDKATWCRMYVQGPAECQRSDVAQLCCHSCARYLNTQPTTTSTIRSLRSAALIHRSMYDTIRFRVRWAAARKPA